MKNPTPPVSKLTLESVQERFWEWRKSKQQFDPIPDELWHSAIELVKEYPPGQVSKALRLDHSKFKDRVLASQKFETSNIISPSFVELDFANPHAAAECIVETEDKDGSKMKICIKGQLIDVMGLAQAFWARES